MLRWRQAAGTAAASAVDPSVAEGQSCPSMKRVIETVFKKSKPEILDLGPLCGDTVVYLANRGARVSVEEFEPPPPTPEARTDSKEEPPPLVPLRFDQPDGKFDLVLAWEHFDFIPKARLAEFGAELHRVLAEGGWLLLFSLNSPGTPGKNAGRQQRYRLVADDRLVAMPTSVPARRRWVHPTRDIERVLGPLSVQGLHLQRNQMREFLALKTKPKPKPNN